MSLIQFFLNKFLIIENFDQKDMYPFRKKLILIFPDFLIFLKLALINQILNQKKYCYFYKNKLEKKKKKKKKKIFFFLLTNFQ